jgi:hypothetical protein
MLARPAGERGVEEIGPEPLGAIIKVAIGPDVRPRATELLARSNSADY